MEGMRRLLLFLLAAATIVGVAAFAGVARPQAAHGDVTTPTTNNVTVSGHGTVTAVPDEATVSAGVRTDAATAAAALAENAQLANAVVDALKKAGGQDLQTQQVSLYPQTDEQGKVTGYVAQNTISAKAKIVDAGGLVDAAVGAGATNVDGPTLSVSDQDALYRAALKKAVEDARARAQAIAEAGGFALGQVTSVNEQSAATPPIMYDRAAALSVKAAPTPIEPGKQDVTADVTVSFAIR
jgi:uncharacterized protein YggE